MAIVLIATLASAVLPASTSGAPTGHGAPSSPALPLAQNTFAARAGYAAWVTTAVSGMIPATHVQSVDVVFEPQNDTPSQAPGGGALVPVSTFAQAHGLSSSSYAAATTYFVGSGLRVIHAWPDHLALSLSGTPAALDRAFGTNLVSGSYDGRPVVFPATAPALPATLESEVAGVVGLSNGFAQFTLSLAPALPPSRAGASPAAGSPVMPGMARSLYGLSNLYNLTGDPTYASAETIAIVLWGAGYSPSDLGTFFADDYPGAFPQPLVAPYPIDGAVAPSDSAPSSSDPLAVEELTLDLEWSGSMAPGATLDAVYAPGPSTTNLTDAFEQALSLPGVDAISMSFGADEAADSGLIATWDPLFSEAADRDITVLAATGDTGGDLNASCQGGPAPEFPASSPKVLAVGGTAVSVSRNIFGMVTGFNETAWGSSGGGYSARFSAPGWQLVGTARTVITANGSGRGTPDVSATALDNFIYFNGANQEADGTSFATPLWAGVVAELDAHIGRSLGFFTDRLYHVVANQTSDVAHNGVSDIVGGGTCIDPYATKGWDPTTGWGTPRAEILTAELVGSFVNLTVDTDPTTVAPGGSVTVSVQVANFTTGAAVPAVPVLLRLAGSDSVGPCTGTFDRANLTTNATGWVSVGLSVPACYLGAHAVLSASVASERLYGQSSSRIAVNLLGFFPGLVGLGTPPYSYLLYTGIMAAAVATGGWIGRRRPPSAAVVPPSTPTPNARAPTTAAGNPAPAIPPPAAPGAPPDPAKS